MSDDKTEEPTPQRLRKARSEGDVPVSSALTQVAAMMAAVIVLPTAAQAFWLQFRSLLRSGLRGEIPEPFEVLFLVLQLSAPVLLAAAAAALAFGGVQTQGLITPAKLYPKFENLDPIAGLKKLIKPERLFQVFRAALLASLVTWLSVSLVRENLSSLVATVGHAESALGFATNITKDLLWLSIGVSLVLAGVDLVLTRRSWLKRHRMSKDEVKREHKDAEGDPQLKQERHRAHQEMLNNASILAIKDADVLIVNPTHLATALRYNEEESEAPRIVAQGEGVVARQLMDAARAYGIPIVRDVPVARALKEMEVGDEIPEALYETVAEILREVWSQSGGESEE